MVGNCMRVRQSEVSHFGHCHVNSLTGLVWVLLSWYTPSAAWVLEAFCRALLLIHKQGASGDAVMTGAQMPSECWQLSVSAVWTVQLVN